MTVALPAFHPADAKDAQFGDIGDLAGDAQDLHGVLSAGGQLDSMALSNFQPARGIAEIIYMASKDFYAMSAIA